ncbi:MAG: SUF system Fe-S cluster assembly regulator [Planctomycetota bacterium]
MIKLTRQADFGVLLMTYFARLPRAETLTARALAEATRISLPSVSKVLKILARARLLVSQRGAHGGYALARAARDITMVDMLEALEGPIAITECSDAAGMCEKETWCPVRSHWQVINRAVQEALDGVTLEKMICPFETAIGATCESALAASGATRVHAAER